MIYQQNSTILWVIERRYVQLPRLLRWEGWHTWQDAVFKFEQYFLIDTLRENFIQIMRFQRN
jgi:hypothetical protein